MWSSLARTSCSSIRAVTPESSKIRPNDCASGCPPRNTGSAERRGLLALRPRWPPALGPRLDVPSDPPLAERAAPSSWPLSRPARSSTNQIRRQCTQLDAITPTGRYGWLRDRGQAHQRPSRWAVPSPLSLPVFPFERPHATPPVRVPGRGSGGSSPQGWTRMTRTHSPVAGRRQETGRHNRAPALVVSDNRPGAGACPDPGIAPRAQVLTGPARHRPARASQFRQRLSLHGPQRPQFRLASSRAAAVPVGGLSAISSAGASRERVSPACRRSATAAVTVTRCAANRARCADSAVPAVARVPAAPAVGD